MATKRLELNQPQFGMRALNFINLLSDPTFQKEFFADPGGVALREFQLPPSPDTVSEANKLVFTLLSDKNFHDWVIQFQHHIETKFPMLTGSDSIAAIAEIVRAKSLKQQIEREFTDGIVKHLDPKTVEALKGFGGLATQGLVAGEDDIAIFLLVFVVLVVVVGLPIFAEGGIMLSRQTVRLVANQLVHQLKAERVKLAINR
jgi:hypothetical protein